MKKFLLFIILFFITIGNSFAINDVDLKPANIGDDDKIKEKIIEEDKKINHRAIATSNGLVQAFCDLNKLEKSLPAYFVKPEENQKIIQTFLNVYGGQFELKIKSNKFPTPQEINKAEKKCLEFRAKNIENDEIIKNLYKQVRFYTIYYKNYPDQLTEGISPTFVINMIEIIDGLFFYLTIIIVFNILYRAVLYGYSTSDKKEDNKKSLINSFLYLGFFYLLKAGIIGGLIAFLSFDSVDLIKIIF